MVVAINMIAIVFVGLLWPKEKYGLYFAISVVLLGLMFFFLNPPYEYDLYRHYELLAQLQHMNFRNFFSGKVVSTNNLFNEYSDQSMIYLIYAFIISKIPIPHLLPVISTILIYGLMALLILKVRDTFELSKLQTLIIFTFLLFCVDIRSATGIRNMLAFSIFVFTAYEDMIKKRNKIVCFVIYMLTVGIHISTIVFLILRILTLIKGKIPKIVVGIAIFFSYSSIDVIKNFLMRFSALPVVTSVLNKIAIYYGNEGRYNQLNIVFHLIMITFYIMIWVYPKFCCKSKEYSDFLSFFIYSAVYTLGSIAQPDIFIRNDIFLAFLIIPILGKLLSNVHIGTSGKFIVDNSNSPGVALYNVIISLILLCIMIVAFLFYYLTIYRYMDIYFSF